MNMKASPLPSGRSVSVCPRHSAESHQRRHRESPRRLYLWFHGLFGFYFKADHIVVVTPFMEEHCYLAGPWWNEKPLKKGEWYRLHGANDPQNPNSLPKIEPTKDTLLPGISKVDLDSSYFLMRLDFPKQIIPVRYVPAAFVGSAAQYLHAPFPLVHIFEYEVFCLDCLRLDPLDEWPARDQDSSTINLHVFAEPDQLVPNEHAMHAFKDLVQMFSGIDLHLNDSRYNGQLPLDPNIPEGNLPPELDPNMELSLAERITKSGTQPANCFALLGQP
ncbi:MAG TPA: hypothetical protein VI685_04530 [Candidatus Angelobacter sp.]